MSEQTNEQPRFAAGDVVQLRSGGPAMTVVMADSNTIRCEWYSEASSKFEGRDFKKETLHLSGAPKASNGNRIDHLGRWLG